VGADKATLTWASLAAAAGSGTLYDPIRGDLATLRATGSVFSASCFSSGSADPFAADSETPAPDGGFYYLVSARNACGGGGYGVTSAGAPRSHPSCP
jgi:hypothetical protein